MTDYVRQQYSAMSEYVEVPARRAARYDMMPPRPPYPVEFDGYYGSNQSGRPDEYVLVKREHAPRILEYPDERYYQYVSRP